MSRSFKRRKLEKIAVIKDKCSRYGKRAASSAVRRAASLPRGKGGYRKLYNSFEICDYRLLNKRYTKKEFRRIWQDNEIHEDFIVMKKRYKTWKEAYREYLKAHFTK